MQQAVDDVAKYWDYINQNFLVETTASIGHLREFIQAEVGSQLQANELMAANGMKPAKVVIQSTKLKNHLSTLQNDGKLDITPRTKDVNHLMWVLGWKHTVRGWEER